MEKTFDMASMRVLFALEPVRISRMMITFKNSFRECRYQSEGVAPVPFVFARKDKMMGVRE